MPDLLPAQSGILDPSNPLSFAFGGGSPTPMSLEQLKRRQAVAMALASQKRGFPKNIGEGLTSLGEAVGDRMAESRLTAAEAAYKARTDAAGDAAERVYTGQPVPAPARVPAPAPVPGVPAVPGPRTDAEDPLVRRNNIAGLISGPGVRQENPTEAGVAPPQTGSPASDDDGLWSARSAAIGGIESGGRKDPYSTVGIQTKYGPALGKYGIVAANVGPWSAAALGKPLTPQEFLADPEAQDAVFRHRFGTYVAKFGEEGAARAWYGGPGNINKTNLMDDHQRLTIGGYGQDYLRRLQGAATATSGASGGGGDAGASMTIDSATGVEPDNPVTPTSIQPAPQAGGDLGRMPGAFDPPGQEPAGPAAGMRAPVTTWPRPKPEPPSRDGERPTQLEIEGYRLRRQFADDPRMVQQAETLMARGKEQRDAAYTLKKDVYEKDIAAWNTQDAAEQEYSRKFPGEQFKLEKERQAEQQAQVEREQRPLGLEKHQAIVKDSHDQVKNIPSAMAAIGAVKELLASNPGMFTGKGAGLQADLAALANKLGLPYDPRAENTQTFRGMITPIIAALRPSIVGPGSQSQPEFKLLQDAAAGNVSLERGTIERILTMIERQGVRDAIGHQRTVIANAGSDARGERLRQVWGNSYHLPMEKIVPRGAIAALRKSIADNPEARAAEIKAFDKTYHTPGLGEQVLGD